MPAPRKVIEASLKEDLKQNWTNSSYQKEYTDQFGFKIRYGTRIWLRYRDNWEIPVHSVAAAKLISTIILNDIVMNKKV